VIGASARSTSAFERGDHVELAQALLARMPANAVFAEGSFGRSKAAYSSRSSLPSADGSSNRSPAVLASESR
jgi:hypothetical protein